MTDMEHPDALTGFIDTSVGPEHQDYAQEGAGTTAMTTHHDIAYSAHLAAVQRLQDLTEAMWAKEGGTDIDWAELGAVAPYDGCDDCVVREVATVVIAKLEAAGAIRVLNPPTEGTDRYLGRVSVDD